MRYRTDTKLWDLYIESFAQMFMPFELQQGPDQTLEVIFHENYGQRYRLCGAGHRGVSG